MNRRQFLTITGRGILASSLFAACASDESSRPNIILIMADDMGLECLSCYGSQSYQTPVLDQLAETGIRFTQCHAQPLCTPSRVKIMTGKYNYRNYEAFGYLNPNQRTFGNVLKEAGYATCIVGKWQLNGLNRYQDTGPWPGWDDNTRPHHFGFDEYCLWQLTKKRREGERYANPLIEQNGKVLTDLEGSYGPEIFANYATNFIRRHQNQPFFLYYPMVLVHEPFVPTPDSPEWADPKQRYQRDSKFMKDMMAYTDKIVGQFIQTLQELGLRENTVVIFTGDNGTDRDIVTQTTHGPIKGEKGRMVDAGTRVPLIIHWPAQIQKAQVYDNLVDFCDFYPTLADFAGVAVESDGQSLFDLLTGKPHLPRETMFMHYQPRWGYGDRHQNRFARTKNYKLYMDGRFYHVAQDPKEAHDLADADLSTKELKIKEKLQTILNQAPPWNQNNEILS